MSPPLPTPPAPRVPGAIPTPARPLQRSAGRERRPADDVEVRELRLRRGAADLDQLAVARRASARQAAASEREPPREPVDRAEIDEGATPGRLPEDLDTERPQVQDR